MRIAFCSSGIHPLSVGGIQRHSRLLIEHLARIEDIRLHVIHPHDAEVFPHLETVEEFRIEGIDAARIYFAELYRYSKRVARILDTLDVDVIYAQGFSVWHGIRRFAPKLVLNPHGLEMFQAIRLTDRLLGLPFRMAMRHLFRHAAYTVSLGGRLTTILRENSPDPRRIVVIPNAVTEGLAARSAQPDPGDRFADPVRILFVGRFAANKGIHHLLNAVARLQSTRPGKFICHLAGYGPLFEEYRNRYASKDIVFHGMVDDDVLDTLYRTCNLFMLPTLFEGMPTVVLEAMAYGLPIVVTDVGATADQVDDRNGWLVKRNDVGAIESAIRAYADLPSAERSKLGEESRRRVEERFTWPQVARQYHALFEKVSHSSTSMAVSSVDS